MRVFVSCQAVDEPPAKDLIESLRNAGFEVDCSPLVKWPEPEPRWQGWYAQGLDQALAATDVFVFVIDAGWDSSTWMAEEADRALRLLRARKLTSYCSFNPDERKVNAAGMGPYLDAARAFDSADDLTEWLRTHQGTDKETR